MRDNFNINTLSNNMFADLNSLIPVPDLPVVTNISTNVYYGYQSLPVKNEYEKSSLVENTEMEVQYNCLHENIQENTRVINRKRRCSEQQETEFKKKRQNEEKVVLNLEKKNLDNWELNLEEELLKHTHGFCSYHWRNETDL